MLFKLYSFSIEMFMILYSYTQDTAKQLRVKSIGQKTRGEQPVWGVGNVLGGKHVVTI